MKSFTVLAVVAGVASAQSLGPCAQMCADNMAKIANTQFQCGAGDISCFCSKSNWAFGVRDCSAQACSGSEAAQAVTWATGQCVGVAPSVSGTLAAIPILSSALASGAGALSTAVTTVPLVATITNSAGSVVTTTTGFSTAYSQLTGSAAAAASGLSASLSSVQGSLASSASGAVASAASSASAALSSAAGSLASAASSAAASATGGAPSGAAGPMMTAMPFAAGAGMAAMFFL